MAYASRGWPVAAGIGFLLVVPFAVLERFNTSELGTPFPFGLFILLWLVALGAITLGNSVVGLVRAGAPRAAAVIPRVVLSGLLAYLFVALLIDQIPCFLGVPNCD
jgi:hypothetical protein